MPFAFGVFAGCIISLVLLSWFRGQIKWLIFGASVIMTVGCGCLSLARVDNINAVYAIVFIAGIGVGGITIPVSTIATMICPGDVIATVTALTIAVRIVGGAIGYAVYFNVFVSKLIPELKRHIPAACARAGIEDPEIVLDVIQLTSVSLVNEIRHIPGITEAIWAELVAAGQVAYANAYRWVYYCSVAFGAVSVLASFFLGDIPEMIDDVVVAEMREPTVL
jgi:hypothetical protein